MCMMEDVLKIFQLFFGSPSGRAPQAVKPVLIEDRVVTSMELIAAAHAVLPHVDGRLPGHACSSIAINFATAPSHVSSWAVAGRARSVIVSSISLLRLSKSVKKICYIIFNIFTTIMRFC
jgi:hypothetical protein